MSKVLSQKLIALFLAILVAVAFMTPFIGAESPSGGSGSKVTKTNKKAGRKTKSGTELVTEVMDIIGAFGGDAVSGAIEEFLTNLKQTTDLLQSLANADTIEAVNFLIRNALSSFGEAARKAAKTNGASETMQSSDVGEFLASFKSVLVERCQNKSNFPADFLKHVEAALTAILPGFSEMYKNVMESTGFGLTFGLLSQGTSFLSFLERPEYVSKATFAQFVNFPEEIKSQFETVIEELAASYIDPAQLDMMLNMAKMYAQNFARRGEHEDL